MPTTEPMASEERSRRSARGSNTKAESAMIQKFELASTPVAPVREAIELKESPRMIEYERPATCNATQQVGASQSR